MFRFSTFSLEHSSLPNQCSSRFCLSDIVLPSLVLWNEKNNSFDDNNCNVQSLPWVDNDDNDDRTWVQEKIIWRVGERVERKSETAKQKSNKLWKMSLSIHTFCHSSSNLNSSEGEKDKPNMGDEFYDEDVLVKPVVCRRPLPFRGENSATTKPHTHTHTQQLSILIFDSSRNSVSLSKFFSIKQPFHKSTIVHCSGHFSFRLFSRITETITSVIYTDNGWSRDIDSIKMDTSRLHVVTSYT